MVYIRQRYAALIFWYMSIHALNIAKSNSVRVKSLSRAGASFLALDFDGVVCASSEESSFASILSCKEIFSSEFSNLEKSSGDFMKLQKAVMEIRPIIETGYENMIACRVFKDQMKRTGHIDVEFIKSNWSPQFRDKLILQSGYDKETLIQAFGRMRDSLIADDISSWINMNKIYDQVYNALRDRSIADRDDVYIVTTKQRRFVSAIMDERGISPPPDSRIFDLDNPHGPKTKVLQWLKSEALKKESHSNGSAKGFHFVEDRFETLLSVAATPGLEDVQLYLVDWGYNTPEQRVQAQQHSRISLIDGDGFKRLIDSFSS